MSSDSAIAAPSFDPRVIAPRSQNHQFHRPAPARVRENSTLAHLGAACPPNVANGRRLYPPPTPRTRQTFVERSGLARQHRSVARAGRFAVPIPFRALPDIWRGLVRSVDRTPRTPPLRPNVIVFPSIAPALTPLHSVSREQSPTAKTALQSSKNCKIVAHREPRGEQGIHLPSHHQALGGGVAACRLSAAANHGSATTAASATAAVEYLY